MQLWGYRSLEPPNKHQKAILDKLVIHIYNEKHYQLITTNSQLIAVDFFFGIRSCEYSTNPKGEEKKTRILRMGDIILYRKRRKLTHNIGRIHLAYKVSPNLRTYKNGVKNATYTQWRTGKHLWPVHIWADIILRLDSYPVISDDTPWNMV